MIELDQLLGDCTPEQAMEFFRKGGEFHEEHYMVSAIKKHLRSEIDRAGLSNHDISIEDALNGRVEGEEAQKFVAEMYKRWNTKIGKLTFGE